LSADNEVAGDIDIRDLRECAKLLVADCDRAAIQSRRLLGNAFGRERPLVIVDRP
jgi:hypothetical protein